MAAIFYLAAAALRYSHLHCLVEEEARKTTLSITSSGNYTWANNGQTYVTSGTYFGNNENGNIQELVINITE